MKNPILLLLALGLSFASIEAHAQCRSFTKKNCIPALEDYVQNENYNSAILIPGDEAELMITFLAGQNYRLVVCGHPILGEVQFDISDNGGRELFNSENAEDSDHVDFRVESTQQLMVRVRVPESNGSILHEGCVSILLGSKE